MQTAFLWLKIVPISLCSAQQQFNEALMFLLVSVCCDTAQGRGMEWEGKGFRKVVLKEWWSLIREVFGKGFHYITLYINSLSMRRIMMGLCVCVGEGVYICKS